MTDGFPFDVDGIWLKAALHTPTRRSDGDLEPEAHVRHHEWMGFDVCAITDHWTLTPEPSTQHILVITGAELAADPGPGMDNDAEILAIGISDIPEDPGGDRSRWGPIDAYHYKTFPDLSAAAASIEAQTATATLATDYWATFSTDGGASFGDETHIAGSFDMLTAPNSGGYFLGDYQGLAAAGDGFISFFVQAASGSAANRTDAYASLLSPPPETRD